MHNMKNYEKKMQVNLNVVKSFLYNFYWHCMYFFRTVASLQGKVIWVLQGSVQKKLMQFSKAKAGLLQKCWQSRPLAARTIFDKY